LCRDGLLRLIININMPQPAAINMPQPAAKNHHERG
jgi:hypothetical protein